MIKKAALLFETVKYLKFTQIVHQIKYRLFKPKTLKAYAADYYSVNVFPLAFTESPPVYVSWNGNRQFMFLNIKVNFEKDIDWNFREHGKLWNYNLQYANYLLQEDIPNTAKAKVMISLYNWLLDRRLPLEPYPVSLRTINMIRWLCEHRIDTAELLQCLYAELNFLSKHLEYHLLGNHLLENAFALLMGGAYFSKEEWIATGQAILSRELKEQVLADGAHFELSPMYHQIIFFRLLELIDWYSKWEKKEPEFEGFLRRKVGKMRAWLEHISFKNGDIPHFNDSADGIAYSTKWLIEYAERLAVQASDLNLGESGYRSVSQGDYECKIDIAQIGPSYQPGHAHADALSFILYYKGEPLFVEQGTSTYQIGDIRKKERSTSAHNTVTVENQNQSNVWGAFRVAERAVVTVVEDQYNRISAQHNGYRKFGITHKRTFEFGTDIIKIVDEVQGNNKCRKEFHLHVYPGLEVTLVDNGIEVSNGISVAFDSNAEIQVNEYTMANGYNQYKIGKKIVIPFANTITTKILMKGKNP